MSLYTVVSEVYAQPLTTLLTDDVLYTKLGDYILIMICVPFTCVCVRG